MGTQAAAALRLRGREGRVSVEVTAAPAASAPVVVVIGDVHRELVCRRLGETLGAMTLSTGRTSRHDAESLIDWTGDHAAELGGDPNRVIVAGVHAGADLAASVAIRARDEGWPRIAGQALIHPRAPAANDPRPLHGVAPALVETDTAAGRRYAARLRSAGVWVALLDRAGDQLEQLARSAFDLGGRPPNIG